MNKAELLKLIPELEFIENPVWQEKCIQIWLEALTQGGWTAETIAKCPIGIKTISADCPESCLSHCRRVIRIAKNLCETNQDLFELIGPCDSTMVILAAAVHDVGKFLEYTLGEDGIVKMTEYGRMFKHPCSAAHLCAKYGLPEKVTHAVLTHSNRQSPEGERAMRTPESLVLRSADYLAYDYVALHYKKS